MRIKTFGYLMAGHTLNTLVPVRATRSSTHHRVDWQTRWENKASEVLFQHIRDHGGMITLERPPQYIVYLLERLEAQRKIERIQDEGLIERVANASVFTYRVV